MGADMRRGQVIAVAVVAIGVVAPGTAHAAVATTPVSVAHGAPGTPGNGPSSGAVVSADGRFVAFSSRASNLVAGDTNGLRDAFVRDLVTSKTRLMSDPPGQAQANGTSHVVDISADGRFVSFPVRCDEPQSASRGWARGPKRRPGRLRSRPLHGPDGAREHRPAQRAGDLGRARRIAFGKRPLRRLHGAVPARLRGVRHLGSGSRARHDHTRQPTQQRDAVLPGSIPRWDRHARARVEQRTDRRIRPLGRCLRTAL